VGEESNSTSYLALPAVRMLLEIPHLNPLNAAPSRNPKGEAKEPTHVLKTYPLGTVPSDFISFGNDSRLQK
jgi:hypothetical protein